MNLSCWNMTVNRGVQRYPYLRAERRREGTTVPRRDRAKDRDSCGQDLVSELCAERLYPRRENPKRERLIARSQGSRIHDLLMSLVHVDWISHIAHAVKRATAQTRPPCTRWRQVHRLDMESKALRDVTLAVHLSTRRHCGSRIFKAHAHIPALHTPLYYFLGALGAQNKKSQVGAGSVHLTVHLVRHPTQVHQVHGARGLCGGW